MNKKAEKKLFIACIVLLALCLLTAGYFFQQALNAKYATVGQGSDEAQIARFSVSIEDQGEGLGWENGGNFDPFQQDKLTYTCNVVNGSEVKIKATPKIDATLLGDALEVDESSIQEATLTPGETGQCKIAVKLKPGYSSVEPSTISGVKVDVDAVQQRD